METITLGDKRIGIKTSVLEEKATACNMLCCYADELKEGFFPWIDQVSQNAYFLDFSFGILNNSDTYRLVHLLCRWPQLWFHFSNFISMKKLGKQLFRVYN